MILAVLAAGAIALLEAGAEALPDGRCRVVWVTDGDTVRAICPGRPGGSVRLTGFDTPEVFSPGCVSEWVLGTRATGLLTWRILRAGEVRLTLSGRDRYGRHLGRLTLDGQDVAGIMIEAGLARPYSGGRRESWCG